MFCYLFVIIPYLFSYPLGAFLPKETALSTAPCGEYPDYQIFTQENSDKYSFLNLKNFNGSCIDCNSCEMYIVPWIMNCNLTDSDQWWDFFNLGGNNITLASHSSGHCLQLTDSIAYSSMSMEVCNSFEPLQRFTYDSKTGYISSAVNQSLCISAMKPNCSIAPFNTYPYCTEYLPIDDRVDDLVSRLTLDEKVLMLNYDNVGVYRLGLPPNVYGEALHGIKCLCGQTYNGNTGCPTSFPHALLLGATFNRTLWADIAKAISTEGRAFANQGITGLFYWAPNINLFRDPRWGRGMEVPGEDPYLTSQYVMQYGYNMGHGEDERYLKVVSTPKHYADYDQEGTWGINRLAFNGNVTQQDQVEYYWPAWRAAIQVAKIKSIMCSYPAINDVPACGNDYFMNQIARNEWGFDGFVISDEGALADTAFINYVNMLYPDGVNTPNNTFQQIRIGIQGGCDVDLGNFWVYNNNLKNAVLNGFVKESDVDTASKRLWKRVIELGKLDNPGAYYKSYGPDKIDSPKHRALALNAAEQGIVLLKNSNNLLPLTELLKNRSKKIAVIGPHFNATKDMLSSVAYHGENTLVNTDSPYMAIQNLYGNRIYYSLGCDYVCNNTNGFQDAIDTASQVDYSIVFLGLHPAGGQAYGVCGNGSACEAEGLDRNSIEFPGYQLQLLKEIYNITGNNTILVLMNGGSIDISWAKMNIPSIIESFYPGQNGGSAITNILFGLSPVTGKLPYTLYDKSFLSRRPTIMDMNLRDNGGITYRYYTGTVVYPFGYGLYYTTFTYKYYNNSNVRYIDTKMLANAYRNGLYYYRSDVTSFVVQVTNTGNMASDCIVLGFVTSENDPDAPLIKLFDFQRVYVNIGQSINVSLSISPESISITNIYGNERIVPGKYNLHIGDYQNNNYITTHLIMTGEEESIFNLKEIKEKYLQTKNK